jgi:hypothetical protein
MNLEYELALRVEDPDGSFRGIHPDTAALDSNHVPRLQYLMQTVRVDDEEREGPKRMPPNSERLVQHLQRRYRNH